MQGDNSGEVATRVCQCLVVCVSEGHVMQALGVILAQYGNGIPDLMTTRKVVHRFFGRDEQRTLLPQKASNFAHANGWSDIW